MLLFGTPYTSFNSDWRRQHINFFSHKSYALSFYKVTWGVKRAGCLRGGQRQPEVQIIVWLSVREVLIGVKFKWDFMQWSVVRQIWKKLHDTNSNLSEKKITKPSEKFTQNRDIVQLHLIMNNLTLCIKSRAIFKWVLGTYWMAKWLTMKCYPSLFFSQTETIVLIFCSLTSVVGAWRDHGMFAGIPVEILVVRPAVHWTREKVTRTTID